MSTKTIIAWVRGEAKEIEITDVEYLSQEASIEERVAALENSKRPNVVSSVTLLAANWNGDASPYSQVVTVGGAGVNSKIDLQPTALQIKDLQDADIAFVTDNDNGTITVYALGGKPTVDYTMQALITEVAAV